MPGLAARRKYGAAGASVVALLLLLFGCGAEPIPPFQQDLRAATQFRPYTLFHAGTRFGGLRMTRDGSFDVREFRPGGYVVFSYGQCIPSGEHDTCNPPVTIANYPVCHFPALDDHPRRTYRMRGTRVAAYYDYGVFVSLEVKTGFTHVVIQADKDVALRAVRKLRAANAPISVRDPLPSPRRVTPALRQRLCSPWP